MSKALEDKGGETFRQQTLPCTCGFNQRIGLEQQHSTVTTAGQRFAVNRKGAGLPAISVSAPSSSQSAGAAAGAVCVSPSSSPSFQGARGLIESGRNGDVNYSPSHNAEDRGGGGFHAISVSAPSSSRAAGSAAGAVCVSPSSSRSFQEARGLIESGRNGDVNYSSSHNASLSSQGERSLGASRRSTGEVQQAKSPSVHASPSSQGERSLGASRRSTGDVQQAKSPSVNASASGQAERSYRDNRRGGDVEQLPKSHSLDASPSFQRVRSLRESVRIGDWQQAKSPSIPSPSRASPAAASPSTHRGGSLEESVTSGGSQANSAASSLAAASPSRAGPASPSSTCTSLKSKLAAGRKLYGVFLVSFSTVVAEILGWAGYDFVVVDLEHLFPGDNFAALPVLQALASTGTPAIFRLPGDDPVLVNKALDMGPAGLMFSMIENEEAARNAVASCRYPPGGIRRGSRHVVSRASRYGLDASYMDRCEEELFVMCQVETTEALTHIMEIAGVEGVDCIQMGGLDFGASLGDPYLDYNKEKVLSRQGKVLLAGIATPESSSDSLFKRGYHLVSGAVDVVLLRDAAVADLRRNKPSLNT